MSVCSRQFAIDCPFPLLVTFWLADAKFSSPPSDQYPSCAAPGRSWTLLNALLAQEVRHIQDTATNAQHLLTPGIAGDPTLAPRAVEAPTAVDARQQYFRGESDRDMPDTDTYRVFVDDNCHYMDPDERYELGSFEDCESAVAACKRIEDEFLSESCKPGRTSEELWHQYVSFGEDPWIATDDPNCLRFSALK